MPREAPVTSAQPSRTRGVPSAAAVLARSATLIAAPSVSTVAPHTSPAPTAPSTTVAPGAKRAGAGGLAERERHARGAGVAEPAMQSKTRSLGSARRSATAVRIRELAWW